MAKPCTVQIPVILITALDSTMNHRPARKFIPYVEIGASMDRESNPPEKLVGALSSGLNVLRYLSQSNGPVGVSQVARDLQLNPSTCFNLLKTLAHGGFAKFHKCERAYSIDFGIISWLNYIVKRDWIVMVTRPKLEDIAEEFGVTASLWSRVRGNRMLLIDQANNEATIRLHMNIGQRLPIYIGAFGRCMAAHDNIDINALRDHFKELRWESPPSFSYYLEGVDQCRRTGFAVDRDNFVLGVTTISAPILDQQGAAVSAISVVGLSGQVLEDRATEMGSALKNHAEEISRAIFPTQSRGKFNVVPHAAPGQGARSHLTISV